MSDLGAKNTAGTGHSYEIANLSEVQDLIRQSIADAEARGLEQASRWFASKQFLKYVTSKIFTLEVNPLMLVADDESLTSEYILSGIRNKNKEYRMFSPSLFETTGPDLHHLLDWFSDISKTNPRIYAKITRMNPLVIVDKAEEWITSLSKQNNGNIGEICHVLSVDDMLSWYSLEDSRALTYEGSKMSHCVGSYAYTSKLDNGTSEIYSLRKKHLKSILTVETTTHDYNTYSLCQIQGKGNTNISIAFTHHIVALLNHLGCGDHYNAARHYNIEYKDGKWSSILDTWRQDTIQGRSQEHKVISDGKRAIYFGTEQSTKPLLELFIPQKASLDTAFTARSLGHDTPHYDEQVLICNLLNDCEVSRFQADWCKKAPDSQMDSVSVKSTYAPMVTTLEQHQAEEVLYYKTPIDPYNPPRYLIPHSLDRAKIIATIECSGTRLHFTPETAISKSQLPRCFAVLNEIKANQDCMYSKATSSNNKLLEQFRDTYEPYFVEGTWRSFALECKEQSNEVTGSSWRKTDYRFEYNSKLDIHKSNFSATIKDGIITFAYGLNLDSTKAKELIRILKSNKLLGDFYCNTNDYAPRSLGPLIILGHGNYFTWIDKPKRLFDVAHRLIEKGELTQLICLGLLRSCNHFIRIGKLKDKLVELRNLLLRIWISQKGEFSGIIRKSHVTGYGLIGNQEEYSLVDMLCDLYDSGFRPSSKQEVAQLRKHMKSIAQHSLYSRSRPFLHSEFKEVLIRWYPYAGVRFQRAIGYIQDYRSWCAKYDVLKEYRRILADRDAACADFRSYIFRHAAQYIDELDINTIPLEQFIDVLNIYITGRPSYYFYGSNDEIKKYMFRLYKERRDVRISNRHVLRDMLQISRRFKTPHANR